MSQPQVHHFIFHALHYAIYSSVPPVKELLDSLCEHGLIKEDEKEKYSDKKKGIKRLISKLRNRNFDNFVEFVKCILEAADKSSKVSGTIVNSIRGAAEEYDEIYGSNYMQKIPQNPLLAMLEEDEDSGDSEIYTFTLPKIGDDKDAPGLGMAVEEGIEKQLPSVTADSPESADSNAKQLHVEASADGSDKNLEQEVLSENG